MDPTSLKRRAAASWVVPRVYGSYWQPSETPAAALSAELFSRPCSVAKARNSIPSDRKCFSLSLICVIAFVPLKVLFSAMPLGESLKNWRKSLRNRSAVSLPAQSSTASLQRVKHEDAKNSDNPSSNGQAEQLVPSTSAGHVQATSASVTVQAAEPRLPVLPPTLGASGPASSVLPIGTPSAPPFTDVQAHQATAEPGAEPPQPVPNPGQQIQALSTSQKLWNDAYNSLEEGEETTKFVHAYGAVLAKIIRAEAPDATAASGDDESRPELKDPETRQAYMRKLVEEGQARIAKASKITKRVGEFAKFVLSAKGVGDLVVSNIPQAALPWAGVCAGLQILLNPVNASKANLTGIAHVAARMEWYCALTEHLLSNEKAKIGSFESVLKQLERSVLTLYKALLLYQMKSVCSYYRNQGVVALRSLVVWDNWEGDLTEVTDAEAVVETLSAQYYREYGKEGLRQLVARGQEAQSLLGNIHQTLQDFITQQKDNDRDNLDTECLRDLRVVDPEDDMKRIENRKDKLLEDAYKWILDTKEYAEFTNWSDKKPCLLWIKGPAGTGKTMLLIGVLRQLSRQLSLNTPGLSYSFCQAGTMLDKATANLQSLVWMLLVQQPHLLSHLRKKYKDSGPSLFKDTNTFFALSEALQNMLKDPNLSPVYLVIDALDECAQENPGLEELVQLISTSLTISKKVKWIVSIRPEAELKNVAEALVELKDAAGCLVELDTQRLKDPVNAYINHKLSLLKGKPGYSDSVLNELRSEIHQRAENTFLWVALAFQKLNQERGAYALKFIKTIPPGLSKLYDNMMSRIENEDPIVCQDCKKVLVVSALAYRPLSISELAVLAGLEPDTSEAAIADCGSFLTVKEETVYPIHKSATDYLVANSSKLWEGGFPQGHADMSLRSIKAMSTVLIKNIYSLSDHGPRSRDAEPPDPDPLAPIRYSCVYWVDHLCQVESNLDEYLNDGGVVDNFHTTDFLHWLEALSLLGYMSEGVIAVTKLNNLLHKRNASILQDRMRDAYRFIFYHREIIESSPLQVYSSALIFSPAQSITRKLFEKDEPEWIVMAPKLDDEWSACLQTLEGHSNWINSVAWSHDMTLLASASGDKTVKVWDTVTGRCVSTLEGHSHVVSTVAWSRDGVLASGAADGKIMIWDPATGRCVSTLTNEKVVRSIAWSRGAASLASASGDGRVRIWNVATRWCVSTLQGHKSHVYCVSWSPDETRLASVGIDRTIKTWDLATEQCISTWEGGYKAVAWSGDGTRLASASIDGTCKVWDPATGQCIWTFKAHKIGGVYSVAWSPDSTLLATASEDGTIKTWHSATGACVSTLKGHNARVLSVAWAADGTGLASASYDRTVKIWDNTARTSRHESVLEGHSDYVRSIVWSPDRTRFASSSGDGITKIWDPVNPERWISELDGNDRVVWSHDSTWLASASDDGTATVWDAKTGRCIWKLEGHKDIIRYIAWSYDMTRLASSSKDNTVNIWDLATGQCVSTLKGHDENVNCVAWSYDSAQLASASTDTTIGIWDVETGQCEAMLSDHNSFIWFVAWSPDGSKLASTSVDNTVQIWDIATGRCTRRLKGHVDFVESAAWSHDATWLASAAYDKIKIWNPVTGLCISTINIGRHLNRLEFDESLSHCLHTDVGTFDVRPAKSVLTSSHEHPGSLPQIRGYGLAGNWVVHNGQKLLWLPPEYRPKSSAVSEIISSGVSETAVVIGCISGRILVLRARER